MSDFINLNDSKYLATPPAGMSDAELEKLLATKPVDGEIFISTDDADEDEVETEATVH